MKRVFVVTPCLLGAFSSFSQARGVSPYLPLNMEPEIERQIERVLILGDQSMITRPIAAAQVLEALPKACEVDAALCRQVRGYIGRFMQPSNIVHMSVEGGSSSGVARVIPNRYGLSTESEWAVSGRAYLQPNDYILITAGATAFKNQAEPTGSVLSIGFSKAQLDVGYRSHWLSPMTDSAMLLSTEAPTMPSITLSNYTPLTRLGLRYEAFVTEESKSYRIAFQDGFTVGHPQIAGLHLSIEPASGWALGFNRIMQYGGGERGGNSLNDLFDAFFQPSRFDNAGRDLGQDEQFGNQAGSVTSRFVYPGKIPFSIYFEYAGDDTSNGKNYLLGNSALSVGVHIPRIFKQFDFMYEGSEWQNGWYVHNIYQDGLTNDGKIIGHWFGDQRVFNDTVGGRSQMMRIGWDPSFGGSLELRYRTLENEHYSTVPYRKANDVTVKYSRSFGQITLGAEYFTGRNVFGQNFSRVAGFARYSPDSEGFWSSLETETPSGIEVAGAEVFIDAGANVNRIKVDLADEIPTVKTGTTYGAHVAIGARRAVAEHSDLGARIEVDDIDGRSLIGARALDYRYRFRKHWALTGFLGAARYDLATPAYGFYGGLGVQFRDLLPGWDVGLDGRYAMKVARDHVLPTDPPGARADSFYDITSSTFYITRRF